MHTGGDEVSPSCWENNSRIVTWLADHGMNSSELYPYFEDKVSAILRKHGKSMMAWVSRNRHRADPIDPLLRSCRVSQTMSVTDHLCLSDHWFSSVRMDTSLPALQTATDTLIFEQGLVCPKSRIWPDVPHCCLLKLTLAAGRQDDVFEKSPSSVVAGQDVVHAWRAPALAQQAIAVTRTIVAGIWAAFFQESASNDRADRRGSVL